MELRQAVLYPAQTKAGVVPLRWYHPTGVSEPIPDVFDLNYLNLASPPPVEVRLQEYNASRAQFERSEILGQSLGFKPSTFQPAAMCETFANNGSAQANSFIRANLGAHAHFIHIRGARSLRKVLFAGQIKFMTGSCLFSGQSLTVTGTDGSPIQLLHPQSVINKPVASIEADPELSLYEIESCVRQARLIADVAAALPANVNVSVTIDVPRVQYYCYVLEALQNGYMPRSLALQWIQLVDTRHRQVVDCQHQQLEYWFERAGLPTPTIEVSAGLNRVRPTLLAAIESQELTTIQELTDDLAKTDPIWAVIQGSVPPTTLRALINTSYSVEYVRPSLSGHGLAALHIGVEDRAEVKIYEHALVIRKHMNAQGSGSGPALLGLYPLTQIFIANVHNPSLYLGNLRSRFSDGIDEYTSLELVHKLYGSEVVDVARV